MSKMQDKEIKNLDDVCNIYHKLITDKREKIKRIVQSYSDAEWEWNEYDHPKPDIEKYVDLIMKVVDK